MQLFRWLTDFFARSSNFPRSPLDEGININPATGLPMTTPGIGGVDAGGNPYGADLYSQDGRFGHDQDLHDDHRHNHHSGGLGVGGFDAWHD